LSSPTKNTVTKSSNAGSFRRIFLNLSVFQFLTFLRRGVFYTFMINYLYKLMQTVTSTATLGTFNMIASALGQNLLWGKVSDRQKLRTRLIVTGETIAAFAYLIVFLVHRLIIQAGNNFAAGLTIIIGLSILEFFWSMSDVGWASLLTDITTLEIRGKTVGTLNFIASLGRMVGIIFAGFLYNDGAGFQNGTIFFIVTALLLTGAAIMTFTSRRIRVESASSYVRPTQETETRTDSRTRENGRAYWWFLACLMVIVLGTASVNQIFLLFISLPAGLNAGDTEMSLILTAWTIGGMFASLAAGGLVDRIGRMKVIFAALGLAIVTPLLYGLASDVPTMALVYGVNGVAFWSFQTGTFALAGDMIPEHKRGRLFGRYNTAIALSWGPAGILIGGPLADLQYRAFGVPLHVAFLNAFYTSSIIVALGTIFFAFFAVRIARKKSLTRTVQVLNQAKQKS